MDEKEGPEAHEKEEKKPLGALKVLGSVLAAGFGVQSSRNRERDFKHGRAGVYIIAGILFTLVFIGTVVTVVRLVLKSSGH